MAFEISYTINEPHKRENPDTSYKEVDVIATFNIKSQFRPLYVRAEAADGTRITYDVIQIVSEKDSKLAGIDRSIFMTNLKTEDSDYCSEYEIVYMHESRKWYMRKL